MTQFTEPCCVSAYKDAFEINKQSFDSSNVSTFHFIAGTHKHCKVHGAGQGMGELSLDSQNSK